MNYDLCSSSVFFLSSTSSHPMWCCSFLFSQRLDLQFFSLCENKKNIWNKSFCNHRFTITVRFSTLLPYDTNTFTESSASISTVQRQLQYYRKLQRSEQQHNCLIFGKQWRNHLRRENQQHITNCHSCQTISLSYKTKESRVCLITFLLFSLMRLHPTAQYLPLILYTSSTLITDLYFQTQKQGCKSGWIKVWFSECREAVESRPSVFLPEMGRCVSLPFTEVMSRIWTALWLVFFTLHY